MYKNCKFYCRGQTSNFKRGLTSKEMVKKGKFIVVDGCEGAGKTTLIKALAEKMKGRPILVTHEPGGTPFAEKIRELILSKGAEKVSAETMFGLFWAARADHIKNKIEPALKKGKLVICDRFDSTTFAYQIYAEKDSRLEDVFWQTRESFLRETKPDLYIFLDVEPEVGLKRVAKRGGAKTHFDKRGLDFHKRARAGFKEFLKSVPHKIIDANQPLDKVKEEFLEILNN